jgi:hypothetical protein
MRWCALIAALALVLAVIGGGLLNARRDRTVTSTVVQYRYPDGVDVIGCPRGDVCQPLPEPGGGLTGLLPPSLARATVLVDSLLLDTSTSTTIRTVQVLVVGNLRLRVTSQCVPGAAPVPSRETEPTRTTGGPTELAFIRPSRLPGCSVALAAQVPAGMPVPTQSLRQLADELPDRLVD